MSFPTIPEGEDIKGISQDMSSSSASKLNLSSSVLKTTAKSSTTVKSILKKSGENASSSLKKVGFSSTVQVKEVEKYLDPYSGEDFEDENEEDEEDDLDQETKNNTERNEEEGSKVQSNVDFFIEPDSGETRTFEQAEGIYAKLSSLNTKKNDLNSNAKSNVNNRFAYADETKKMQRDMFSRRTHSRSNVKNGLLGRITTNLSNIGGRIRSVLSRISSVVSAMLSWIRSNVFRENSDLSEPVLVSVIYDPNISSSLEKISDLE